MIDLLAKFDYKLFDIVDYDSESIKVKRMGNNIELFVDGQKWNNYNLCTHAEAFQVFPHYYLAKGHCVCTGLGFGIRENWLLHNPNVTKVTVIEKNRSVIDYHYFNKSPFINKIQIIEADANEYIGSCDTLLLDHYEQETDMIFLDSIRKVSNNIDCKQMWAWSIEPIIDRMARDKNLYDAYNEFKIMNKFHKLPDIDTQCLMLFLSMFFLSDLLKNTRINDTRLSYD
jgi:hypothetical protein